jgi:hypothetical protein
MENTENTENKIANSFLADRLAGLVDEVGNPIPQEQVPTTETEQQEVPQAEVTKEEVSENTTTQEEEESQVSRIARERGIGVANPPKEENKTNDVDATEE